MKILLLGATGFIGSYATRQLAAQGHEVTLFHRGQTHTETPDSVRHIHGNREKLGEFGAQFRDLGPDVVVDMLPIGEDDARLVVETFRGSAGRLVSIGSMDVYRAYGQINGTEDGEPDPLPFDEDGPLRHNLYPYRNLERQPSEIYQRYDKILVERVVMNEPKLPGTMLRVPAVFGPGDRQHRLGGYLKEMETGVVKLSVAQSNWKWTRGYVEDVAAAIALAATNERAANRIYNVGELVPLTELEWVRAIASAANWTGPITIEAAPEAEEASYRFNLAADTTRIRRELGYAEAVAPNEALRRTVEWERANAV